MSPRRVDNQTIEEFYRWRFSEPYVPVEGFVLYAINWLDGVRYMTDRQCGWYINLLVEAWHESKLGGPQGTLPNNERRLAQLAKFEGFFPSKIAIGMPIGLANPEQSDATALPNGEEVTLQQLFREVLENFDPVPGQEGLIHNRKLTRTLMHAVDIRIQRKVAANKGVKARWREKGNETGKKIAIGTAIGQPNGMANDDQLDNQMVKQSDSNLNLKSSRSQNLYAGPAKEVFEFWKSVMNRTGKVVFEGKRERAIVSRLREGYSVEQLKQAIEGCAKSDYNMGRQQGQPILHNDIELICRNPVTLDRFIRYAVMDPNGSKPAQRKVVTLFDVDRELENEEAAAAQPADEAAASNDDELQPLLPEP